MKALIPAAGRGLRLRPYTDSLPKCLVRVGGRPILEHQMEMLENMGVDHVGIVVSPGGFGAVGKHLEKSAAARKMRTDLLVQPEPNGIAGAILLALDWIGEEDVLVLLGDVLFGGCPDLRNAKPPCLWAAAVDDPREYGVVIIENGLVVGVEEKPCVPKADTVMAGIYLLDPETVAWARDLQPSARGELEITDLVRWAVAAGKKVRAETVPGWWVDIGTPSRLRRAEALVARFSPEVGQANGRVAL